MRIGIKNYKKATYKNKLTFNERVALITSAVTRITSYYGNNIYGIKEFAVRLSFVDVCTNIEFGAKTTIESKYDFVTNTDVLELIKEAIGESEYKKIIDEIDDGLFYASSTNIETKELLKSLTNLINSFENNSSILSDMSQSITIEELMQKLIGIRNGADSNGENLFINTGKNS